MITTQARPATLSVKFTVPGEPKGKGRHRSRIATTGAGKSFIANYSQSTTVEYENLVRIAANEAMCGGVPTRNPVFVTIDVYCSVPASWSMRKQNKALAGDVLPTVKPDIDNTEKAIFDGMNRIVFRDDVVVCDVIKRKRYSRTPRVEVWVREMDAEPAS